MEGWVKVKTGIGMEMMGDADGEDGMEIRCHRAGLAGITSSGGQQGDLNAFQA